MDQDTPEDGLDRLIEMVDQLRRENKNLRDHIHAGIHCGFFCALPECAKQLSEQGRCRDQ